MQSGCVRRRVAKHAESPLQEIAEPFLLAFLAFGLQRIYRQHRLLASESAIDKLSTVIGQTGSIPDLLCDAFYGLEDRVEVIVSKQFFPAEF